MYCQQKSYNSWKNQRGKWSENSSSVESCKSLNFNDFIVFEKCFQKLMFFSRSHKFNDHKTFYEYISGNKVLQFPTFQINIF